MMRTRNEERKNGRVEKGKFSNAVEQSNEIISRCLVVLHAAIDGGALGSCERVYK